MNDPREWIGGLDAKRRSTKRHQHGEQQPRMAEVGSSQAADSQQQGVDRQQQAPTAGMRQSRRPAQLIACGHLESSSAGRRRGRRPRRSPGTGPTESRLGRRVEHRLPIQASVDQETRHQRIDAGETAGLGSARTQPKPTPAQTKTGMPRRANRGHEGPAQPRPGERGHLAPAAEHRPRHDDHRHQRGDEKRPGRTPATNTWRSRPAPGHRAIEDHAMRRRINDRDRRAGGDHPAAARGFTGCGPARVERLADHRHRGGAGARMASEDGGRCRHGQASASRHSATSGLVKLGTRRSRSRRGASVPPADRKNGTRQQTRR